MTPSIDLADRTAIVDLLYAYAWHFDRNEPEGVAALFTDDATIDYGPENPTIVGRDAIVPAIRPGLQNLFKTSSHHITNMRIQPDGAEAATDVAYVYAWHVYLTDDSEGELWGQYHCRFRRTDEGWKIAEMVLKAMGVKNFHRATMHPIGRRS